MGKGKKRHSNVKPKREVQEPKHSDGDGELNGPSPYNAEESDPKPLNSDPEVKKHGDEPLIETPTELDEENDGCVDVLGNKQLMKKVLDKGLGSETRPEHGNVVTISYKGWLENGTLVEDVTSQTITLGDGDVVQALELALPFAEIDERFELTSDARFTYGSHGREPDIPPDSKLRYEVQVHGVQDAPCYSTMPNEQRVQIAEEKRERGNYYFRREEYPFAVNSYSKALRILTAPSEDLQYSGTVNACDEVNELEIKLHNNLALTQLKIQAYQAAIKSCDFVLSKDPSNCKALFRKGKALLEQGDTDEAIPILKRLHAINPNSPVVAGELQRAQALQQRQEERWKRGVSRTFPNLNPKKEPQSTTQRLSRHLFSVKSLLLLSLLVALCAIIGAWSLGRIPINLNQMSELIQKRVLRTGAEEN